MNIDGLGPAIVQVLLEKELIKSVADLYCIEYDQLESLERFAEKSAKNLLKAIENSKSNNLDRLLFALGIRNIGVKAARLLCEKFGHIDSIMNADAEEISEIDGFGNVMAENVVKAFKETHRIELVNRLREYGVNMIYRSSVSGGDGRIPRVRLSFLQVLCRL